MQGIRNSGKVLTEYIHRHKAEEHRRRICQFCHLTVRKMVALGFHEPAESTNSSLNPNTLMHSPYIN